MCVCLCGGYVRVCIFFCKHVLACLHTCVCNCVCLSAWGVFVRTSPREDLPIRRRLLYAAVVEDTSQLGPDEGAAAGGGGGEAPWVVMTKKTERKAMIPVCRSHHFSCTVGFLMFVLSFLFFFSSVSPGGCSVLRPPSRPVLTKNLLLSVFLHVYPADLIHSPTVPSPLVSFSSLPNSSSFFLSHFVYYFFPFVLTFLPLVLPPSPSLF